MICCTCGSLALRCSCRSRYAVRIPAGFVNDTDRNDATGTLGGLNAGRRRRPAAACTNGVDSTSDTRRSAGRSPDAACRTVPPAGRTVHKLLRFSAARPPRAPPGLAAALLPGVWYTTDARYSSRTSSSGPTCARVITTGTLPRQPYTSSRVRSAATRSGSGALPARRTASTMTGWSTSWATRLAASNTLAGSSRCGPMTTTAWPDSGVPSPVAPGGRYSGNDASTRGNQAASRADNRSVTGKEPPGSTANRTEVGSLVNSAGLSLARSRNQTPFGSRTPRYTSEPAPVGWSTTTRPWVPGSADCIWCSKSTYPSSVWTDVAPTTLNASGWNTPSMSLITSVSGWPPIAASLFTSPAGSPNSMPPSVNTTRPGGSGRAATIDTASAG